MRQPPVIKKRKKKGDNYLKEKITERTPSGLIRYSVWKRNKAVLWYYPSPTKASSTPLFLIYSPVNRADILDLLPGLSTIESFLSNGFDVYLLDFGVPGYEDKDLSMNDYIVKYIQKGVQRALLHSKAQDITIIGYCLGGTLATIYAAVAEEPIRNLILYVTPIDFETVPVFDEWAKTLRKDETNFDKIIEANGVIPPSSVKAAMRLITSPVYFTPYLSLMSRADDEEYVKKWKKFNNWANSYLPLSGALVKDLINELGNKNKLVKGTLMVDGKNASLRNIRCNLLVISSENDQLVPKEQTYPIMTLVSSKDKTFILSMKGHTGVSIRSGELPEFLQEWLPKRSI